MRKTGISKNLTAGDGFLLEQFDSLGDVHHLFFHEGISLSAAFLVVFFRLRMPSSTYIQKHFTLVQELFSQTSYLPRHSLFKCIHELVLHPSESRQGTGSQGNSSNNNQLNTTIYYAECQPASQRGGSLTTLIELKEPSRKRSSTPFLYRPSSLFLTLE